MIQGIIKIQMPRMDKWLDGLMVACQSWVYFPPSWLTILGGY